MFGESWKKITKFKKTIYKLCLDFVLNLETPALHSAPLPVSVDFPRYNLMMLEVIGKLKAQVELLEKRIVGLETRAKDKILNNNKL